MNDAFARALEIELEHYQRELAHQLNTTILFGTWGGPDRYRLGWPKEYEIIPGWLAVAGRYRRARGKVRRFRYEVKDRTSLAWRALKGDAWDY